VAPKFRESLNRLRDDWLVVQAKDFLAPRWWAVVFDDLSSEIDPCIDAGRPRCMRHRLPHAWRAGRGMQVLLFPLRAFGDGGTGELVDGGIAARPLVNPIAACIKRVSERMCKQVSVSLPYEGDS